MKRKTKIHKQNNMKAKNLTKLAAILLAAGIASSCGKKINLTYTEVEVQKQDITTSVTATGTIEPVTSVDVGTQVSGIVSKLYVDYNSIVKAGDVIAGICTILNAIKLQAHRFSS